MDEHGYQRTNADKNFPVIPSAARDLLFTSSNKKQIPRRFAARDDI